MGILHLMLRNLVVVETKDFRIGKCLLVWEHRGHSPKAGTRKYWSGGVVPSPVVAEEVLDLEVATVTVKVLFCRLSCHKYWTLLIFTLFKICNKWCVIRFRWIPGQCKCTTNTQRCPYYGQYTSSTETVSHTIAVCSYSGFYSANCY